MRSSKSLTVHTLHCTLVYSYLAMSKTNCDTFAANEHNVCDIHILKPCLLRHALWASISSRQCSSPFSTMQVSRALFVSGQAQHGFNFFSSPDFCPPSSPDLLEESALPTKKSTFEALAMPYKIVHIFMYIHLTKRLGNIRFRCAPTHSGRVANCETFEL